MATRSNACSELVRFWLEARLSYLVTESVPVPVPYGLSDIDFLAIQPKLAGSHLPNGQPLRPRLIVEAKDEHDWEPSGREFGACLAADVEKMGDGLFIPKDARGVKFTMLREQHYRKAEEIFGTEEFDRLFIVHAMSSDVLKQLNPNLEKRRIFCLTIRDLVADLVSWYGAHARPAALRNTLTGDLLHLLIGFCGLKPPPAAVLS